MRFGTLNQSCPKLQSFLGWHGTGVQMPHELVSFLEFSISQNFWRQDARGPGRASRPFAEERSDTWKRSAVMSVQYSTDASSQTCRRRRGARASISHNIMTPSSDPDTSSPLATAMAVTERSCPSRRATVQTLLTSH